jgi:hypothetical protein
MCYFVVISPVLLTLCDRRELNSDYSSRENAEAEEYDQVHGIKSNMQARFTNNHFNNEVTKLNSLSNNGEDDTVLKTQGEKFIYNNATYLLTKENKTEEESNETEADYDYDYDQSHNIFNWSELIPTLVVYSATMVIGIAGNSLIIFTICRYRRMKSTTNVFLASLASADLLLITICIPVKVGSRTSLFLFSGH